MITQLLAQPTGSPMRAPVHPAATGTPTAPVSIVEPSVATYVADVAVPTGHAPTCTDASMANPWLGGKGRGLGFCTTTTGFGTKRITPGSLGGST